MSKKKTKRVHGPWCGCQNCDMLRTIAVRLVNNNADLRDIREEYRPFVLAERERRNPARPQNLGGSSYTVTHGGKGQYAEGEDSPWHENAIRALEDGGEA